jgi:hypothetical protein
MPDWDSSALGDGKGRDGLAADAAGRAGRGVAAATGAMVAAGLGTSGLATVGAVWLAQPAITTGSSTARRPVRPWSLFMLVTPCFNFPMRCTD